MCRQITSRIRSTAAVASDASASTCVITCSTRRRRAAASRSDTAAPSSSPVPATMPMKICSSMRRSPTSPTPYGPQPWIVPHTAMPDASTLAMAAPGDAEADGRPDQEREDGVLERVAGRVGDIRAGEDGDAHRQQAHEQHPGFRDAIIAAELPPRAQGQQRRSDEHRANRVAKPPRPPQLAIRRPGLHAAGAQAGDADGGARSSCSEARRRRRARARASACRERTQSPVKRRSRYAAMIASSVLPTAMQAATTQRLVGGRVGHERANEDPGPCSSAVQEGAPPARCPSAATPG